MLAEIHGKISRQGTNLSERVEDNLTGNIFGALRYLPFHKGLGAILSKAVFPSSLANEIGQIQEEHWADAIKFWPYDREGEIDLFIEFEKMIIGIEVKLYSGLSSDDTVDNTEQDFEQSCNQLARESRIISRLGGQKKKILLFIADRYSCIQVYKDVTARGIIEPSVSLGYISWQDFLHAV